MFRCMLYYHQDIPEQSCSETYMEIKLSNCRNVKIKVTVRDETQKIKIKM